MDCGVTGTQSARGKARLRCTSCKTRRGNEAAKARVDVSPIVCVDCDTEFTRATRQGPRPKRCPSCTRDRNREHNRQYSPGPLPAITWCEACGAEVQQHPRAPRLYCDPCGAERDRETQARWWAEHPEAQAAKWRRKKERRRARKAGCDSETFDRVEVFGRDGWRCYLCGDDVDPELAYPDPRSASLDHVVPLAAGGAHTRANTACTHLECNVRKHAKIIQTMEG